MGNLPTQLPCSIKHTLIMANLLQATGRLTWLALCEFKGNGKVVSLTQIGKEMQVVMMISLSNNQRIF